MEVLRPPLPTETTVFLPPRCPNQRCPEHFHPQADFFRRNGSYNVKCRREAVPRFICRMCSKGFSRQTFRADYHDNKPSLNRRVVELLTSGVGLRETARILEITRKNFDAKWRKIARHGRLLDLNLKSRSARANEGGPASPDCRLQFDEFETYEGRRNTRPLSIATMIESSTRFIIGAIAAPIRAKGKMSPGRLNAIEREDAMEGRRIDRTRVSCRSVFRSAAKLWPNAKCVCLETDQKSTYPGLFAEAFAHRRREHVTVSGKAPRGAGSVLLAINETEAVLREHVGRVRRNSWLTSKLRTYLNLFLPLYTAWKNWVIPLRQEAESSPGVRAGMAPRNLCLGEMLGWRQDWQQRSPCPFSNGVDTMGTPLQCPLPGGLIPA